MVTLTVGGGGGVLLPPPHPLINNIDAAITANAQDLTRCPQSELMSTNAYGTASDPR